MALHLALVLYYYSQDSEWQPVMGLDTYLMSSEATDLILFEFYMLSHSTCIVTFAWCWFLFPLGRSFLFWKHWAETGSGVVPAACSYQPCASWAKIVRSSRVFVDSPPLQGSFLQPRSLLSFHWLPPFSAFPNWNTLYPKGQYVVSLLIAGSLLSLYCWEHSVHYLHLM